MSAKPLPVVAVEVAMDGVCHERGYFPIERPRLFGWSHASNSRSDGEVVVCKAFGYESMCAHRNLMGFARMMAAAGFSRCASITQVRRDATKIHEHDEQLVAQALNACAPVSNRMCASSPQWSRAGDRYRVHIIETTDHTFTYSSAR